jgi:DNA-binding XRE family transcriptional regulator
MTRKFIPAEEVFRKWRKDPGYRREYDALEEEFVLAATLINARAHSGLTQEEIAERMDTSQQAISRLEGGRGNPSWKILQRYARATGTRARIVFEPTDRNRKSQMRKA